MYLSFLFSFLLGLVLGLKGSAHGLHASNELKKKNGSSDAPCCACSFSFLMSKDAG